MLTERTLTRRQFKRLSLLGALYALTACGNSGQAELQPRSAPANSELYILWERGYLSAENQGILELAEGWQRLSGRKVNLKLVSDDFIEQSLLEILKNPNSETAPDIVFSVTFNHIIAPILAWHDRLLNLSSLIQPIAASFHANMLPQALYRNQVRDDRSYYALPIGLSDAYIHWWNDLLAEIGYSEADIPSEWNSFWRFWETAHAELRSHQHPDLYGLGLCLSANGFDTSAAFQLFLSAHRVGILSDRDEFILANHANQQRLIDVITEFAAFYRGGYIPSDAMEWSGSGNNIAFLNRRTLMTLNMTLSIPRSQKLEDSPYNKNAAQRYRNMSTLATYPKALDGTPLQIPRIISQILVPKHHRQSPETLDFLQYLLKPDNIRRLIHGFQGRILPAMPKLLDDSLWQDPSDSHSAVALAIYQASRPSEPSKWHPVFSQISLEQLWAQILNRVIQGNASPTQAAAWGTLQIQKIWEQFEGRS